VSKYLDQNGLLYFWQKIKALLNDKVDKEAGKGLSTNDYTTDEKNKLGGIEAQANKTIVNNTLASDSTTEALSAAQGKALNQRIDDVVEGMGDLGYGDMMKMTYDPDGDGVVDNASALGGQAPSYYAKATDIPTKVSTLENDAGYLKSADIEGKLDKTGDGSNVTVTFAPASTRDNVATGEKMSIIIGKIAKFFADLKTVAFTGSYNDLTNKPNIPTVTNDLTNELKGQYDAAYQHSQAAHAPSNAQENVIETINVNGTPQQPTGKAVNITVPTTVAALTDAGDYAKKSDLTNVYQYAGSVATYNDLPQDLGPNDGPAPVYNVEDTGMNWGWTGTAWDNLGQIFTIESISNQEIDTILAS